MLRELHDDLDRAVFDAYGWNDLAAELVGKPGATTPLPDKPAAQAAAEEELLSRLVKLNAERAAEEARGLVRWQRPEYQQKAAGASGSRRRSRCWLCSARRSSTARPTIGGTAAASRSQQNWLSLANQFIAFR